MFWNVFLELCDRANLCYHSHHGKPVNKRKTPLVMRGVFPCSEMPFSTLSEPQSLAYILRLDPSKKTVGVDFAFGEYSICSP